MTQEVTEEFKMALRKATRTVQEIISQDNPSAKALLIADGEHPHHIEADCHYPKDRVVVEEAGKEFTVLVESPAFHG